MCMVKITSLTYPEDIFSSFKMRYPKTLYEDNDACIAQLREGYIKEIEQNIFHQNSSLLTILEEWRNRCSTSLFEW